MDTHSAQTASSLNRSEAGILLPPPLGASSVIALLAVVVVLLGGVFLQESSVDFDAVRALNMLHVGAVAAVTNTVYAVFGPLGAIVLTVAATALIWVTRRDVRPAAAFAAVIAGTWLPSAVVKVLVERHRPELELLPHPFTPAQVDASYPSGHSVFIVAAAVAICSLAAGTRLALVTRVLAPIVVVVVLLSLLVDGVHYPTDVLASVVWGLGVAPFVRAAWLRAVAPRIPILR